MSTTEERAQMLYDKALTELNTYLEDMKTKPPQEIINSAYQIVNKQDLLMILESAEFTPAELNVLNELEHPLQVLYEEWLPVEDRHMEELRDSVQSYLDTRLQHRAEKLYADPSVFRYEGSYSEAREKGEVHLYRANRKRDRACIDAFTENISDANEARRMREFVQEWTQEFGHDRCKFLLGYTVQCADWDGRYSAASKREAAKTDYHITPEHDPFSEFHTNAHPCLVNYAYELLIEQERDKKKSAPKRDEPER